MDIAITSWASARWQRTAEQRDPEPVGSGGSFSIPVDEASERWIRYYWPLFESTDRIPQIYGEEGGDIRPAFREPLSEKPLPGGFVEAIEYAAAVRGAERWEP